MKIKITLKIQGMSFTSTSNTIAMAYDYVKAIITKEREIFHNQEESLSEYMNILVKIMNGEISKHENNIFKIESEQI